MLSDYKNMYKKIISYLYSCAPILLILTTMGWGTNTIVAKVSVNQVSPMMIVFLRWFLLSIILLYLQKDNLKAVMPTIKSRILWFLLMGGVGICSFNSLFYIAAYYTTAINLGVIQSSQPALVIILSYFLFKSKINFTQFTGLLFTFLGVLFVVSGGQLDLILNLSMNFGDLIMISACIFYAGYTVGMQNRPKINELTLFTFISFFACLASIPMLIIEISLGKFLMPSLFGWLLVFYVTLVPSFISQIFYMRGIDLLGANKAGLYTNLVPVFAAIFAITFIGEKIHFYHLLALISVFFGIYLFQKSKNI